MKALFSLWNLFSRVNRKSCKEIYQFNENQCLETKPEQEFKETTRSIEKSKLLKDFKKERSFTLEMILDYCCNHTNYGQGLVIIGMINYFFLYNGGSTEEERRRVSEIEHRMLFPYAGIHLINNQITLNDPRINGPMYEIKDNSNVYLDKPQNGKE